MVWKAVAKQNIFWNPWYRFTIVRVVMFSSRERMDSQVQGASRKQGVWGGWDGRGRHENTVRGGAKKRSDRAELPRFSGAQNPVPKSYTIS